MGKNWSAVAAAINTRLAELDMQQKELAARSGVGVATLRKLQHPETYPPQRRAPWLLAAISEALGWSRNHLAQVLEGESEPVAAGSDSLSDEVARLRREMDELRARVDNLESRDEPTR